MFGWDVGRTVELNDVVCSQNSAEENGGCFYGAGRGVVNDGTSMLGNLADQGGCVCESLHVCMCESLGVIFGEIACSEYQMKHRVYCGQQGVGRCLHSSALMEVG